jgi:hypothetical protein
VSFGTPFVDSMDGCEAVEGVVVVIRSSYLSPGFRQRLSLERRPVGLPMKLSADHQLRPSMQRLSAQIRQSTSLSELNAPSFDDIDSFCNMRVTFHALFGIF